MLRHHRALPAVEPVPAPLRRDRSSSIGLIGLQRHRPHPAAGSSDRRGRDGVSSLRDGARGSRPWPRSSCATSRSISARVHVIKDVNLTIEDNEFIVLLGPSGCGKTTTLRAIAGLEDDRRGRHPDRRQAGAAPEGCRPRHRHGVPVLLALPAHDRLREHRLPAARHAHEPGRGRTRRCARSRRSLRITEPAGRASRRRCRAATCSASPSAARWCAGRRRC